MRAAHRAIGFYGERKDLEESDLFDTSALENGYITVTPLDFDATRWRRSFLKDLDMDHKEH